MWIEGASANAAGHDAIMWAIHIIVIIAFVLVNSAMVYFIIRYRRRGPDDKTSRVAHHSVLEVTWTIIPSIVFLGLYVWGTYDFVNLRSVPQNAMEVNVAGKQWNWTFTYPADLRADAEKPTVLKSSNILYLEAGRPTKLVMESSDVLHSFFVPAFRVKEDVVPGMYTYISFTPLIGESFEGKDEARYAIYCTEYCGLDHSGMIGEAVVMTPNRFREQMASLEEAAGDIGPERGQEIYQSNCIACHTVDGSDKVGPTFAGLFGRTVELTDGESIVADENYIRQSILDPTSQVVAGFPPAMPAQDLDDAQIQSVIMYIKTLE